MSPTTGVSFREQTSYVVFVRRFSYSFWPLILHKNLSSAITRRDKLRRTHVECAARDESGRWQQHDICLGIGENRQYFAGIAQLVERNLAVRLRSRVRHRFPLQIKKCPNSVWAFSFCMSVLARAAAKGQHQRKGIPSVRVPGTYALLPSTMRRASLYRCRGRLRNHAGITRSSRRPSPASSSR